MTMNNVHHDLNVPEVLSKPELHVAKDDMASVQSSYNQQRHKPADSAATQAPEEERSEACGLNPSAPASLRDFNLGKEVPSYCNASTATGSKPLCCPSSGTNKVTHGYHEANDRADSNLKPQGKAMVGLETHAIHGSPASHTTHSGQLTPITDVAVSPGIAGPCEADIAKSLFAGICKHLREHWGIAGDRAEEASDLCVKVFAVLYPAEFGALQLPRLRDDE